MRIALRVMLVVAFLVAGLSPVGAQEDSTSVPAVTTPTDNELPAQQPAALDEPVLSGPATQIEVPVVGRQRPPVVILVLLILGLLAFSVLGAVRHVRRDEPGDPDRAAPVRLPPMRQSLRPPPLAQQSFEVLTVVLDSVDYELVEPKLHGRFSDYDLAVDQAQLMSETGGDDASRTRWVVRSEESGQIVLVFRSGEKTPVSIADPRLQSIVARVEPGSLRGIGNG